jgi:hypothetical protein
MKLINRKNSIRMTLAAGLLLAAAGAAAGECIEAQRPNYAEMAGPSIRMQAAQAMVSIQNELRLTAGDVTPMQLERPATAVVAEGNTPAGADKSRQGDSNGIAGGLVIYIGNR